MSDSSKKNNLQLTAADDARLQQTTITDSASASILSDFQLFLDYVQENDVELTKNNQLPMKVLQPINGRLSRPIHHNLSRPTQKSLPNVAALYLLLQASGLASIDNSGKKPKLKLNEHVLPSWQGLNATERYFTLLESWLMRGSEQMLGEDSLPFFRNHLLIQWFYLVDRWKQPDWLDNAGNLVDGMRYSPGLYNLALMEMFGLATIEAGKPVEKGGWWITAVAFTQYGISLLKYLTQKVVYESELLFKFETPAHVLPGQLQPFIQPYFPQWQNNLYWPQATFRSGTYTFRVSIDKNIWRRIIIDAGESLETLASTILEAFHFDNDHLHEFIYTSHLGTKESVKHPNLDEGPYTHEVSVGDIHIPISGTMLFHFDFGDNWYFELLLETVAADIIVLERPKIIESHGNAPKQYLSYSDS